MDTPVRYDQENETLVSANNECLIQIAHKKNNEYDSFVSIDLEYLAKAINFYEEHMCSSMTG